MEEHVGGFGDRRFFFSRHSGERGFHRFLAEFLGTAFDTALQQPGGVGSSGIRRFAGGDGGIKPVKRVIFRHQLPQVCMAANHSGVGRAAHQSRLRRR